jgi:hypothetical protein
MSILTVNLGNYANDGTGDDLRTAFEKVNSNFTELDLTRIISAENLGSGAPVFLGKDGTVLLFRSIKGGQNVEVSYTDNELTISTVNLLAKIEQDLEPRLGGDLDLNGFDIKGSGSINLLGVVEAPEFRGGFQGNLIGNVTGTVSDISNHKISDLNDVEDTDPIQGQALVWTGEKWSPGAVSSTISENYDFGVLGVTPTDPLQLSLQFTTIDFDTIYSPSSNTLDMGGIDETAVYYELSKNKVNVVEGSNIIITLKTTNLNDGTAIPYLITGIESEDINDAPLTGNFIIVNNKSTLLLFASITNGIEISKSATITLTGISPSTSISFNITNDGTDLTIDGGSPNTVNFLSEIDGGSPSTAFFSSLIDGGSVVLVTDVDGGGPTSTFISIIDGGVPSTITFDEITDGGIIV